MLVSKSSILVTVPSKDDRAGRCEMRCALSFTASRKQTMLYEQDHPLGVEFQCSLANFEGWHHGLDQDRTVFEYLLMCLSGSPFPAIQTAHRW